MTLESVKNLDKNDFLHLLGLEARRAPLDYLGPALAVFGVGVVIGAGVGLLLAPRPGRELREDIARGLQSVPDAVGRLPSRASELARRASDQLQDVVHEGHGKA